MNPSSNSSFIPKKTIQRVQRVRTKRRIYVLSYVSYSLFFGTLLVAGALFLYSIYLNNILGERIAQLEEQRVAFSQSDIEQIKEFESWLRVAEYYYDRHVSAYAVLRELEAVTSQDVIWASIGISRLSDVVEITLEGQTVRFDAVAFQQSQLKDSSVFAAAEMTDLTRSANEVSEETTAETSRSLISLPVSFSLITEVDPALLRFDLQRYVGAQNTRALPSVLDSDELVEDDLVIDDDFTAEEFFDDVEDEVVDVFEDIPDDNVPGL